MAELPTFISSAKTPSTTGFGSPRFVKNIDPMGEALQTVGNTANEIAADMYKTRNAQAVNEAKLGSTLKLDALTTELSKMDPAEAMAVAPGRIQEIYSKQTEGMNEASLKVFNQTFTTLNAQAQTNINASAIKNHNDQQQANLTIMLDSLKKTVTPIKNPLSVGMSLKTANDAISEAIAGRNITREEGVKMFIKFRKEAAEEGVQKWINSQTSSTLMDAYDQMDKSKISNQAIQFLWNELDEDKKNSLRKSAITEISRLGTQISKAEAADINKQTQQGKSDLSKVYNPDTSDDERTEAIERLKANPQIPIAAFKSLIEDTTGQSSVFNNRETENGLHTRIIKRDGTLTIENIIKAEGINFETKQQLINAFNSSEKEEMKSAVNALRTHPLFVPKDISDRKLNSDNMNAAQAKIHNELIQAFDKNATNKNFNPMQFVNDAINKMQTSANEITEKRKISAQANLASKAITDRASLNAYISENKLDIAALTKLQADFELVGEK